jgi:hypothetical protein
VLGPGDRIRNLLGEYAARLDAGDFDGVGALFALGSLAAGDDAHAFATGADEVAAFYRASTQLHDGSPRTKHLVSGTVLSEPDGAGRIVARSSYVVLQAVDGLALQPIIAGRYVDTFAPDAAPDVPGGVPPRVGGGGDDVGAGWHFVERRFHVDLIGDLSLHLRDPSIAEGRAGR